jgi:selenocysteine-specific elongation factor
MIIGTAGHIDHGKSALVEALTGQRMDPLAEERRRGITIELHFAALSLPGGGVAGVVDVPGHEDLVRAMVAGAVGMDLVLLVVAADEGIMPQSREHLAVVEQLAVPAGIPVITKSDLVEPEWLRMVEAEVSAWLSESRVRFVPPMATSVRTGAGIEALRALIISRAAESPSHHAVDDLARLPIDRAFSLPGAGTVVAGTSWSGVFRVGDAVRVLPGDQRGRIRSLERHGEAVPASAPGERIAVALAGVDRPRVARGEVLVHDADPWEATRAIDVQLEILPRASRPLLDHARIRVHVGTLEVLARVQLPAALAPGSAGPARLVLEAPAIVRGGDRIVIRSYSPVEVLGGGWVMDPLPPRGRAVWSPMLSSELPEERLHALIARRPRGLNLRAAPVLLGSAPSRIPELLSALPVESVAGTVVSRASVTAAEQHALQLVRTHHAQHPAEPGLLLGTLRQALARSGVAGEAALDRLVGRGELVVEQAAAREAGFRPSVSGGEALVDHLVELVDRGGLSPPSVGEIEDTVRRPGVSEALRLAARAGRVVAVERDRYFSPRALTNLTTALAAIAASGPITPAAVREATGVSRKYLIPLLEWSDRAGFTVRRGEARAPGPALRHPSGG